MPFQFANGGEIDAARKPLLDAANDLAHGVVHFFSRTLFFLLIEWYSESIAEDRFFKVTTLKNTQRFFILPNQEAQEMLLPFEVLTAKTTLLILFCCSQINLFFVYKIMQAVLLSHKDAFITHLNYHKKLFFQAGDFLMQLSWLIVLLCVAGYVLEYRFESHAWFPLVGCQFFIRTLSVIAFMPLPGGFYSIGMEHTLYFSNAVLGSSEERKLLHQLNTTWLLVYFLIYMYAASIIFTEKRDILQAVFFTLASILLGLLYCIKLLNESWITTFKHSYPLNGIWREWFRSIIDKLSMGLMLFVSFVYAVPFTQTLYALSFLDITLFIFVIVFYSKITHSG